MDRQRVLLDFEANTGAIWTVVNERDEIGLDVPPDNLTSVTDGGFYGFPYSCWGPNVDQRVNPPDPDLVSEATTSDYGLGPHTASLGLTFYRAGAFPPPYCGGAFVGQHGSWNRQPLHGYRVVFIPFANGRPRMPAQTFLHLLPQRREQDPGRRRGGLQRRAIGGRRRGRRCVARRGGDRFRAPPISGSAENFSGGCRRLWNHFHSIASLLCI